MKEKEKKVTKQTQLQTMWKELNELNDKNEEPLVLKSHEKWPLLRTLHLLLLREVTLG